jgi:hypothetical protein
MNVKTLKERIADIPDDYDIQLQTMVCVLNEGTEDDPQEDEGPYELHYHEPIIGIAFSDEDKEMVFIMRNPNLNYATLDNYEEVKEALEDGE